MDPINDYFSLPDDRFYQRASWGSNPWQSNMPHWDTTPIADESPLWQYAAPVMSQSGCSTTYYTAQTPLSPSYTTSSSSHSTLDSPLAAGFAQEVRHIQLPVTPIYENITKLPNRQVRMPIQPPIAMVDETMEEDGDSDAGAWEPKVAIPRPVRPTHRRSASANEALATKRAHTVVEKNYRERLNDKINDLALYLFETSSDARAKPSKSLVMTKAKERLKQLESRNAVLEKEVLKLRQRIAILDHVAANPSTQKGPGISHEETTLAHSAAQTKVKQEDPQDDGLNVDEGARTVGEGNDCWKS